MKNERYARLVAARKDCRVCPQLANPSVVESGVLDSDRIGPYSQWQGNLDAPLVVVGQDFADTSTFRRVQGWPGERVATNKNLVRLLAAAGFSVPLPRIGSPDDTLFFTNAVLCLKQGSMQRAIPSSCFQACAQRFLRPTIDLVAPRAVAALGAGALGAVLLAYGLRSPGPLLELVVAGVTFDLPSGARVFPLCHPSPTVHATTRSLALQESDWSRVGEWLRAA